MQDIFLGAIAVLDRLVANPEQAVQIRQMTVSVKQMEAVAQILLRKVDTESKYLARLEGMPLHVLMQGLVVRLAMSVVAITMHNLLIVPCISCKSRPEQGMQAA